MQAWRVVDVIELILVSDTSSKEILHLKLQSRMPLAYPHPVFWMQQSALIAGFYVRRLR
jgi:hypothetical protein